MKKRKENGSIAVENPADFRSLADVYPVLKHTGSIPRLAEALGISRQHFRGKCYGPQFFTAPERDAATAVLDRLIAHLTRVRVAITELPTRVET